MQLTQNLVNNAANKNNILTTVNNFLLITLKSLFFVIF